MINFPTTGVNKKSKTFTKLNYFPTEKTCFPILTVIGNVLIHLFVAVAGL